MIDRCGGCGWPLRGNRWPKAGDQMCCYGAGYWSQRAPLPEDRATWEEMLGEPMPREGDWFYYGLPWRMGWRPEWPEVRGYHPAHPLLVRDVYRAYLDKAERTFGARSLIHYQEYLETFVWAEIQVRNRAMHSAPNS